MSLRSRFAIFSLVFAGVLLSFFFIVERQLDQIKLNRRHIYDDWREVDLLFGLYNNLTVLFELEGDLPEPGDDDAWEKWEDEYSREIQNIAELLDKLRDHAEHNTSGKPGEEQEILALDNLDKFVTIWSNLGKETYANRGLSEESSIEVNEQYALGVDALNYFFDGARLELGEALEKIDTTEDYMNAALANVTLVGLAMLAIAWLGFGLWTIRPIRKLQKLVREVEQHNFEVGPTPPSANDEIGELTNSFLDMAREIRSFTSLLEQRVADRTRELAESHRKLELLLNKLPDAVGLVSEGGSVLSGNEAYRNFVGKESVSPFTRPEDFRRTPQGYLKWSSGDSQKLLQFDRFEFDSKIEDEMETPLRISLEYIRDVTRQHDIEAALASSQNLASIGRLSAGIAHEINNPLTSIGACAEGLLNRLGSGESDQETLREYLETIRDEVFRCKDITEKLLDVSRPREEEYLDFDVAEVLNDMTRLAEAMVKKRSMTLTLDAPDHASVYSNPRAIRQILLNLIINATEAGKQNGEIQLSARRTDEELEIEVKDDGDGMDEETLAHIFEPFYTKRRDNKGTGLGLFVCQSLANAMGGSIEARSEGPGLGTSMKLTIPRRRVALKAMRETGQYKFKTGESHD